METQHTPAPWTVEDGSSSGHCCFTHSIQGTDGRPVAEVIRQYEVEEDEQNKANASRIVECVNACEGLADPSAVPELLEALEDLLAGWELMISQYGYNPGVEPEDSLNMRARAAIAKATGKTP